jgi:hypothetical protein
MNNIKSNTVWSRKVKKRDKQCKKCDSTENLEAHHIFSYSKHPQKRLDVTNGITLCKKCHKEIEKLKINISDFLKNQYKTNQQANSIPQTNNVYQKTDQKYGRWCVLDSPHIRVGEKYYLLCQCECGTIRKILKTSLKSGKSKSCGCFQREVASTIIAKLTQTHGQSKKNNWSKEYRCWTCIKTRCINPNSRGYHNYGGRGITICKEWENSFEQFFQDVGIAPSKNHSLDRIDVNGNYEPNNCRWATYQEQMRNIRKNRYLSYKGMTKTVVEWSEILNIKRSTINSRLHSGWDDEKCLSTPVKKVNKHVKNG